MINKAIIVGSLGRDPETRYAPDGGAVTNISVATSERWKDKGGEAKEATEWHRVVFFGKLAEIAGEYLAKGSQVYVEGKIKTREWTDKGGAKKYSTEIIASEMKMLGGKKEKAEKTTGKPAKADGKFEDDDSDIPF